MGLLDNPQDAALMQLGLGLLSAGGPSRSPVSLGHAIGSAGQGAMEEYRRTQAMQQQMAQRKMQEQMQQMQLSQHQMTLDESTRRNAALKQFRDQLPAELQGRFDVDPQGFLKAMSKDQEEYTLTPGAARFKGDKQIAAVPSAEKSAPTPIQEYQFAVGQGYKGSYDQWDRSRRQAGATSIQNYPSPMVAINPATGKPEYVQFGNKGTALPTGFSPAPPTPQAVPATATTAIMENRKALSTIDEAISEVQKKPDALGVPNYLGDAIRQRTDPGGVPARSKVAQVGGIRLHDLSGAAVTATELKRLQPYIPSATDSPEAAVKKLQTLRKEYADMISQQEAAYGKDQGYRPVPNTPPARKEVRRGKYNGKTVVQYSDGSIENAD